MNYTHFDIILRACPELHTKFNFVELNQMGQNDTVARKLLQAWRICDDQIRQANATDKLTLTTAATLSRSTSPALIVYFVCVAVLGLAINLWVISTILRARRLWTITNAFVLSLAFADFLMASCLVPLNIKYKYYPSQSISIALDTLFPLLGVASLLNLAAVTLERFLSISYPFTHDAHLNRRRACFVIATIWLLSIFQALMQFALKSDAEKILYEDLRFAFAFGLPFLCILFANIQIYLVARQHARQILASNPQTRNSNSNRTFFKKMKTVKIIGLLVGTFILTWLPYFVLSLYEPYNGKDSSEAFSVANKLTEALVCGTALFNPLLYGLLRRDVREAAMRGLKCQNVNQTELQSFSQSFRTGQTATTC